MLSVSSCCPYSGIALNFSIPLEAVDKCVNQYYCECLWWYISEFIGIVSLSCANVRVTYGHCNFWVNACNVNSSVFTVVELLGCNCLLELQFYFSLFFPTVIPYKNFLFLLFFMISCSYKTFSIIGFWVKRADVFSFGIGLLELITKFVFDQSKCEAAR